VTEPLPSQNTVRCMMPRMENAFQELLTREKEIIEKELEQLLPPSDAWPERLHRAMRHAVLGGGKRIRPILARLVTRALGRNPDAITSAACGLELIHCYSLVHDDLPALDDDVLRRGRETVHVAFDEATAILVGDALLTEGLGVLAREPAGDVWASRRAVCVHLVTEAIGSRGMVGGQMEDLAAAGQIPDEHPSLPAAERLHRIHSHKTGDLIRVSVELAAVWAGSSGTIRQQLREFGGKLGLAFQIADDLLDLTATAAELGKTPGKDAEQEKLTWVTLYGEEATRVKLHEIEKDLLELGETIEGPGEALASLARHVCRRKN